MAIIEPQTKRKGSNSSIYHPHVSSIHLMRRVGNAVGGLMVLHPVQLNIYSSIYIAHTLTLWLCLCSIVHHLYECAMGGCSALRHTQLSPGSLNMGLCSIEPTVHTVGRLNMGTHTARTKPTLLPPLPFLMLSNLNPIIYFSH